MRRLMTSWMYAIRPCLNLMYGSGLRLSEIQGLNLDGIVLDEGWVSVKGKGGKQRQVPLVAKSIAALRDYLAVRIAKEGEQALFTSKNGGRLGNVKSKNACRLGRCAWAVPAISRRT